MVPKAVPVPLEGRVSSAERDREDRKGREHGDSGGKSRAEVGVQYGRGEERVL